MSYPDTSEAAILAVLRTHEYTLTESTRTTPGLERGVWLVGPLRAGKDTGAEVVVYLAGHGKQRETRVERVTL